MNQLKHLKTFSLRAALVLLVMMLTATTTRALTVTCQYYDNASSSYLEGTVGGTYNVMDGTKLYVTPNPGYYLVSVMKKGSVEPLQAITPSGEDPYYSVSADDDITITFKPYTNNVQVRFNMKNHGDAITNQNLTLGQKVTRPTPDPTAENYDFLGWFTNSSCTTPYDFDTVLDNTLSYSVPNNCYTLTLYAGWVLVSGTCGSKVTWAVTKSTGSSDYDVLTISGSGAMVDYEEEKAPWYPYHCVIKTIVIEEGVTHIGEYAFQNFVNVSSDITIPASVTTIGYCAFQKVSRNTAAGIHISASEGSALTSIGKNIFYLANASIDLSPCTSLTAFNEIYIFLGVTHDVTLPSSITSICKWAFNRFEADAFLGDHAYVVVPEGKALSVTITLDEGTESRVLVPTDGKADILGCLYVAPNVKRTLSRALTLAMVPATINLTANLADGNYWTTFYCGDASYLIDEGENATAYTAEVSDDNVVLHSLNKDIPKNTPVVIKGEDNEISMSIVADPDLIVPANALQGVDVATATSTLGEGTFYVLGKVGDNFGFHRYTGTTMPARKAYLLLSGSAAPSLSMTFGDEKTTGMRPTPDPSLLDGGEWYDLSGRRLSEKPTTKGLYIHNGRKEVVK